MAKPPSGYPRPSRAEPCGKTWMRSLFVTGKLPGKNGFGRELTRTVAPVVPDLQGGRARLGWNGEYEERRREGMQDRLEAIVTQMRASEALLSPRETASLERLIDGALAELDAAKMMHERPRLGNRDRKQVYCRYIDAAWHIRCAEYALWRLLLYRQALAAWYRDFWPDLPDGVAEPDKPWLPALHVPEGLPVPPPSTPPGVVMPHVPRTR